MQENCSHVASASEGIWIIISVRGVLKLIKGKLLPDQASVWLAAWPLQSKRSRLSLIGCLNPTVDKTNSNRINSWWQSSKETISDTSTLQTQAPRLCPTTMVGQDEKQRIEWMINKWCCLSCFSSFDYSRKSDSWSSPWPTHREWVVE